VRSPLLSRNSCRSSWLRIGSSVDIIWSGPHHEYLHTRTAGPPIMRLPFTTHREFPQLVGAAVKPKLPCNVGSTGIHSCNAIALPGTTAGPARRTACATYHPWHTWPAARRAPRSPPALQDQRPASHVSECIAIAIAIHYTTPGESAETLITSTRI
jgi:hypothetical protein